MSRAWIALVALIVLATPAASVPPPQPFAAGMAGAAGELAFVRAEYAIDVYGGTAVGVLIQEFRHESGQEIDAIYTCSAGEPLDPEALHVDIDGAIRELALERDEPQTSQATDRRQGRRPDRRKETPQLARSEAVFVEPEQTVRIRTRFRLPLSIDDGSFRLTLPPVQDGIVPSARAPRESAGSLPVNVAVRIHHGAPLLSVHSSSHDILHDFEGDSSVVELVRPDGLDGRPFVLTYGLVSESEANFAGFVGREQEGRRQITATLTPPVSPAEGSARAKQVLFVLDSSGSMGKGGKLEQAREAVSTCLNKLTAEDRFNVLEFDDRYRLLAPEPGEVSETRRRQAEQWLETAKPGGGTKLVPALQAALEQPEDSERHRMILVVSDGMLGDEPQVLEMLEEHLGDARLFVVGIGPSLRKDAILRLAERGRGAAAFAADHRDLQAVVVELFDAISQPLAWDLHFDWGGADVELPGPGAVPDLYADRPVKVLAWVRGDLPSSLRLRVTTSDGQRDYSVALPPATP